MEPKTTQRFVVYQDSSFDYEVAEFEAKDSFDFAREMCDWFWWSMEWIVLILDKDNINPLFWDDYEKTFGNSAWRQDLLKKLVDSYRNFLFMKTPEKCWQQKN